MRCYRDQPEEATPERSTQHSKQPPHKHPLYIGETPRDLFSSTLFMYSTILNVVSMERGEA